MNEVAAAATDNINGRLSEACPRWVPGTLQTASHAILYLDLMTTLQVGVIPTLQLEVDAQRS